MYLADLHIHSKYSRATSRDCDLIHLDLSARQKGIGLIGTGDFTHPAWRAELKEFLVPAEEGLYTLREDARLPSGAGDGAAPRFVLSGEISSIYKKNGKTRKVHNVILLPGIEAADALAAKLEAIGNIHSDGRPILGLDSRDLLEITLEACPEAVFIPAHIWTPHFALFGAFSGFDTIEECFEDLTPYIHAVETGLSSDPPMNWMVSALDRFTLVSNSDAHSPSKLGREANLIEAGLSFGELSHAIQTGEGFGGTIEFFPEEGKYHLDGHRNCSLCLTPAETEGFGGKCPVCGKKITIGVQHRVEELADRPLGFRPENAPPFQSLAPLPEVIAASTGVSAASKKTAERYARLLREVGPEFYILREASPEQIEQTAGPCVAEGIRRLREGRVERSPGYDGAYGTITLLSPAEIEEYNGQLSMFGGASGPAPKAGKKRAPVKKRAEEKALPEEAVPAAEALNCEQKTAVETSAPAAAVIAGPGTGKTKTLVSRIAHLVEERGVKPSEITAVTFTNLAADEMRERLQSRLGKRAASSLTVGTFHSICLRLLTDELRGLSLLGEADALRLAERALADLGFKGSPRALLREVSRIKNGAAGEADFPREAYEAYCRLQREAGAYDFDDLLLRALEKPAAGRSFSHLLVDEFQDINEIQYRLVRAWSRGGKSLFVIGDPDQAIYGFRGSSARCFERLAAELPELCIIRLLRNYRSAPEILSCSLPMISKNEGAPRRLNAFRPAGGRVRFCHAPGDFAEAVFIAHEISRMVGGMDMLEAQSASREDSRETRSFSDIAVLCRTHRGAELVEKCLRHESIPCIVSGREDYLLNEAVQGALGFFRFLCDMGDTAGLHAALRYLWNVPTDLVEHAERFCRKSPSHTLSALREEFAGCAPLEPFWEAAGRFQPELHKKPRALLEQLGEELELLQQPEYERLLNCSVFSGDMPAFLRGILLGEEGDVRRASGRAYESGAVRVMTLHASKGLEFPVVFLCGVKKENIPLEAAHRPCDLPEERRLFYVGMTRARDELILSGAGEASPFLADIPNGLFSRETVLPPRREPDAEQLSLF